MIRFHHASTQDVDMRYALGQEVYDPVFLLDHEGEREVFLSALDIDAFREKNTDTHLVLVPVEPFSARVTSGADSREAVVAYEILKSRSLENETIAVSPHFPLDVADYLRTRGCTLAVTQMLYPERLVKTKAEASYIEANLKATIEGFEHIESILRNTEINGERLTYRGETLTCEFLKGEVHRLFFDKELWNEVGLIIATGAQGAFPHHEGAGPVHAHKPLVCDLYPRSTVNHYFADMTRTYVRGDPSDELMRMYEAVQTAKDASIDALQPGMTVDELYQISKDVILKAGFDVGEKGYTHGLGHGVGLALHEEPFLSKGNDMVLKPGMILTIEPGLYYPELGGVRLEDMVLVTEGGCRNVTNYECQFVI